MKYKFIAKKNSWFKKDLQCELLVDCKNGSGIFKGIRICENEKSENHKKGEEYIDEELCLMGEFKIVTRKEII